MKKRWYAKKLTLLVIRDVDKSVKQVDVSKLLVVTVPIVTVVSISSFIVGLEMRSSTQIKGLEGLLSASTHRMDVTVKDKDEAIEELQTEVIRLSAEAKDMKGRMQNITAMETKLQSLIHKYGKTDIPQQVQTTLPWDATEDVGGDFIPASHEQILSLAEEAHMDFDDIKSFLGTMEKHVTRTLSNAKDVFENTPTLWPTTSKRLTSSFGYRRDPMTGRAAFHAGVDIAGKIGDPVFAAADGKVITASSDNSHGKYIVVQHPKGYKTWYMHLSKIEVKENDEITKGQQIGQLGNTGRSTGPHLHFQIVRNDQTIDPLPFILNP